MSAPFSTKYILALAAVILALGSCSHDEVTPGLDASYSRSVVYLDQARPARHDTAYQTPALQAKVSLSAQSCILRLQPATSKEGLNLSVPRTQMPASLVGSYTFRAPVNPGQAPTYHYAVNMPDVPLGGSSWVYDSWWLPSTGAAAGELEVTTYDAKRHLLSGRFRLALTSTYDPRAVSTEPRPRRCDLTLTGTFANVPVVEE